jgi:hypothetical protein
MFNFFKKKKQQEEEMTRDIKISSEVLAREEQELKDLLNGEESYKRFFLGFAFKDGKILSDTILPLKSWEEIEKALEMLEKEYDNIEGGNLTLEIKDSHPSRDSDEIASLEIQIKHGYMRPYLKYRAEGETYAEEWKEYDGGDYRVDTNGKVIVENYEFGWDSVAIYNLTKDINLVKTIFKEFYETGDVSEEYMD